MQITVRKIKNLLAIQEYTKKVRALQKMYKIQLKMYRNIRKMYKKYKKCTKGVKKEKMFIKKGSEKIGETIHIEPIMSVNEAREGDKMGLDMNFYKKDFVELDFNFSTRDRDLFNYITEECGVKYGDKEYGTFVKLSKSQMDKIVKYLAKNNENFKYSNVIAEILTAKEQGQDIFINADW